MRSLVYGQVRVETKKRGFLDKASKQVNAAVTIFPPNGILIYGNTHNPLIGVM